MGSPEQPQGDPPACNPGRMVFPTPDGGPCPFDLGSGAPSSSSWSFPPSAQSSQPQQAPQPGNSQPSGALERPADSLAHTAQRGLEGPHSSQAQGHAEQLSGQLDCRQMQGASAHSYSSWSAQQAAQLLSEGYQAQQGRQQAQAQARFSPFQALDAEAARRGLPPAIGSWPVTDARLSGPVSVTCQLDLAGIAGPSRARADHAGHAQGAHVGSEERPGKSLRLAGDSWADASEGPTAALQVCMQSMGGRMSQHAGTCSILSWPRTCRPRSRLASGPARLNRQLLVLVCGPCSPHPAAPLSLTFGPASLGLG